MRCRAARAFIDDGLERELALEERFQLDEHLATCRPCRTREHRARALQELLEGPGDPPVVRPDTAAAARAVFAALDQGDARPWRPRPRWQRPAAAGLLLAAATIALLLALRESPTRVEAAVSSEPSSPEASARPAWTSARVEVAVRVQLVARFGTREVEEAHAQEAAVQQFQQATRELALSGWSVRRFVEGSLENPDPAIARAAARCLGALGGANSSAALERALARREVADTALRALGALGEPSIAALERALEEPTLASRALLQLCRVGGERTALVLEGRARRAVRGSIPSREALLDALTTTGPCAVAALMRLAAEEERRADRAACTEVLVRLALVEDAGPALVGVLQRKRTPDEVDYRALLILRPPEALPWLEQRCGLHRERERALETLAAFPGTQACEAMLRLERGGRVSHERILALFDGLIERDSERALRLSLELVSREDWPALQSWLTLIIESEHPRAAGALVPLVFCDSLSDAERQWAALALGEFGTPADGESLARELERHAGEDRRLTAACVLALHALLGESGVKRFLGGCSELSLQRVLGTLAQAERSGEAVLVYRVARALDGALSQRSNASTDSKAIL